MPKISVIVPICNVEKYLGKCLNSIIVQTLKDIEIICVDDGSKDSSGQIIDEYAKKDARIIVVHKENTGYGNSMNVGIDMAKGEYIGIVESDDMIKENMYECLYEKAKKYDLDVVKSDAIFWWENISYTYILHYDFMEKYYNRVIEDDERRIMYDFMMNTWTGIYKKSFLDKYNIRHNETPGASYQDNGFWFRSLTFCKRAMWLSDAFYMYRQDNPNASVKDVKKVMAMTYEFDNIELDLKNRGVSKEIEDICAYWRLSRSKGTFYRIDDSIKMSFLKRLEKDYDKYKKSIEKDDYLSNWYKKVFDAPDRFCGDVIYEKNCIINIINECKNIVIYGAGKRGELLLRHLFNMGYSDKIKCFVVTEVNNKTRVGIFEVIRADDAAEDKEGMLVFISAHENGAVYKEMCKKLIECKIDNYMACTGIFENFYCLC